MQNIRFWEVKILEYELNKYDPINSPVSWTGIRPFVVNDRGLFIVTVVFSRPASASAAAAALNDRRSDLVFIAESYSGNEVGTVMFLSLPFH